MTFSPVVSDLKDFVSLSLEFRIFNFLHLGTNALDKVLREPSFLPGIYVDTCRREEGFLKEGHDPALLLFTVSKDFPMTGRNLQPAFSAPVVCDGNIRIGSVHATHRLLLV